MPFDSDGDDDICWVCAAAVFGEISGGSEHEFVYRN